MPQLFSDALSSGDERFRHCLEIQRRLGSEHDLARLAQVVMNEVMALLRADRSTLFLFDWETVELRANFLEGVEGRPRVVPLRMGIVGMSMLRREPINLFDACNSPYFNAKIDSPAGDRTDSLLVAPLLGSDGSMLGALELVNKTTGRFTAADEDLMAQVVPRLAKRIENAQVDRLALQAEVAGLRDALACHRGTVFVLDESGGRLLTLDGDGADDQAISLNLKLGTAGLAAVTGRSLRIAEARQDPRFDPSVDLQTGFRTHSMLCVPLSGAFGEPLGVVEAIRQRTEPFSADDLATLEAVAGIVAIAIENALLFADQEKQFHSMLAALVASIEAKDGATAGHSSRVALHALAIAKELGFGSEELDQLRVAAILHDYGKIGISDSVLKKDGVLDAAEYAHMKSHAGLGEDILKRIYFSRKYRNVPLIAACHHERLDGSGYPHGLKGHEIPFLTKILTVADVFEALTADRQYGRRRSNDEALALLDAGIGRRFDRHVVAALRRTLAREQAADAHVGLRAAR